jgi:hypothetical protein
VAQLFSLGGFERMTDSRDMMPAKIESAIRQILSDDWDPIGLHGWPPDEYDRYIGQVYSILIGNHSEDELTKYLFNTARDIGGAQDIPEHFEMCRPAARKLLKIDVSL